MPLSINYVEIKIYGFCKNSLNGLKLVEDDSKDNLFQKLSSFARRL